jgi:hypothetical protein
VLVLLAVILAGLPGQPESAVPPDSLNMTAVSRWDRGAAEAVAIADSVTYLGSGTSVLVIRDSVSMFAASLPGQCQGLLVDGSLLYAAAGKAGLVVLDIADPERPRPVATLDLPGYALDFAKSGSIGAVASADYGVSLLDLSDPTRPRLVSSFVPAESSNAVAIADGSVYIACGSQGLVGVDVSRPESPAVAMRLPTPSPAVSVASKDSIVYVMCGDSGVLIVNAAGPQRPPRPTRMDWPGAQEMAVSGSLAAVACGWNGVRILDVFDPASPVVLSYPAVPGYARNVAVNQGLMSVGVVLGGVLRYNVSVPGSPVFLNRFGVPGYTVDVATNDSIAWVGMTDGLHAVDLSRNPARDIGFCPLTRAAASVGLGPNFAAVALGDLGVGIVRIDDPRQPTLAATLAVADSAIAVAVRDSWVFVGTVDSGVQVVLVDSPERPQRAGALPLSMPALALSLDGSRLAVAAGDSGLRLVNVTDPRLPVVTAAFIVPGGATGVSVKGDRVAACGSGGLSMVGALSKSLLWRIPLVAAAWDVALTDTLCYVATDWAGVVAVNVRHSLYPWVAGWYGGATIAGAVAVAGGDAVMADIYSGLTRLRLEPAAAVQEPTRPEPGIPVVVPPVSVPPTVTVQVMPSGGPTFVSLIDPAGRCHGKVLLAQAEEWQQVGFDAFPLGAGTYFVRVAGQGGARVYRTQLVR